MNGRANANNLRVLNTTRILVVDDMPMYTKAVRHSLPESFDIVTAGSAKEALAFLENSFADLILLDVEMPGMSGIEMFEHMQKNPGLKSIPVVFVTVASDKDIVNAALTMGAKDYIIKPYTPQSLLEKVNRVLSGGREDQALLFLRRKIQAIGECCDKKDAAGVEEAVKKIPEDMFSKFILLKLSRALAAVRNRDFGQAKALAEEITGEL
ncbi:MAG: response regulator receiver modulated metal dependent phosphohydrolase [Treponematales bacterium]|jgi:CheY-like chemotaxis protein